MRSCSLSPTTYIRLRGERKAVMVAAVGRAWLLLLYLLPAGEARQYVPSTAVGAFLDVARSCARRKPTICLQS